MHGDNNGTFFVLLANHFLVNASFDPHFQEVGKIHNVYSQTNKKIER